MRALSNWDLYHLSPADYDQLLAEHDVVIISDVEARCFHLDAAGIDFITPDVSRSWREVDCAVIEVNATPGFSSDARAMQIMQARFPAGCEGRIRTVVLIDAERALLEQAAQVLQADGVCVGMTDSRRTLLGGQQRFAASATLAERVRGLLLDVRCEVLLIGITPAEIETGGFPLDRCSLALVSAGTRLSAALLKLMEACSLRVINDVQAHDLKKKMLDMSA